MDWLQQTFIENEVGNALLRALLVLLPILILVPGLIWWERRLLGWMQDRIGPNRVATLTLKSGRKISFFGLLQPIADGVKLFFKEDITPTAVDRFLYFIAPGVALFPAFALAATLPWGPYYGFYSNLTPVADVNIGVLYILAISALGVYGVVLAGYSSNNKYSLLGAMRSSAQLISYELGMAMALAGMVLYAGSLRMTDMIRLQEAQWLSSPQVVDGVVRQAGGVPYIQNWLFFTPFGFVAGIIFLICMVAETNRAPFDLPEAENELIAGYHTEYSSMKFAVFFMGEYAAMFVFSGIFAAIFLGGYNLLPVQWLALADAWPSVSIFGWQIGQAIPGAAGFFDFMHRVNYWGAPLWFLGKMALGITGYVWLRATLPRLRYDQLMNLGWRTLLPLAVANFIIIGFWIMMTRLLGYAGGWLAGLAALGAVIGFYMLTRRAIAKSVGTWEKRTITMVNQAPQVALSEPQEAS